MNEFTRQYLEALLWSESVQLPCAEEELVGGYMNVDDDHSLHGISEDDSCDDHWGPDDFSSTDIQMACDDCDRFRKLMEDNDLWDTAVQYQDEEHIAHDFCLTRNDHGAGFWDGDYEDYVGQENSIGDQITALVKREFNGCSICIDESGQISI